MRKFLHVFIILVLSFSFLNVFAEDTVSIEEIYDSIPETIYVDVLEKDSLSKYMEISNFLLNSIKGSLLEKDINLDSLGYLSRIYSDSQSIHDWKISIAEDYSLLGETSQAFQVVFQNTDEWNEEDNRKVSDALKDLDEFHFETLVPLEEFDTFDFQFLNSKSIEEQIREILSNDDIDLTFNVVSIGGSYLSGSVFGFTHLFIQDVWYKTLYTESEFRTKVTVLSNVEDVNLDALNQVREYLLDHDFELDEDLILDDGGVYSESLEDYYGDIVVEIQQVDEPTTDEDDDETSVDDETPEEEISDSIDEVSEPIVETTVNEVVASYVQPYPIIYGVSKEEEEVEKSSNVLEVVENEHSKEVNVNDENEDDDEEEDDSSSSNVIGIIALILLIGGVGVFAYRGSKE